LGSTEALDSSIFLLYGSVKKMNKKAQVNYKRQEDAATRKTINEGATIFMLRLIWS